MNVFTARSKWIGVPVRMTSRFAKRIGAPFVRREFAVDGAEERPALIRCCGLGLGEWYLNGEKFSAGLLDPPPSVYDRHCYYREYPVTLKPGVNVIGAILGNGQYNAQAQDFWQFHTAPWRDYPKLIFELVCDGKVLLCSDSSWRLTLDTPIVFNNWHGGEYYDSRREIAGWLDPGFDDGKWENAVVCPGPGGELLLDKAPAAEVVDRFAVEEQIAPLLYDLHRIITGRLRITVRGEAGSVIILRYSDHLAPDGEFTQVDLGQFIPGDEVQTDRYTLHTDRLKESWAPRFVYHSFRYVKISIVGNAEIVALEAEEIRTGFARIGTFRCGSDILNRLCDASVNSYSGNFVGIPTDCPHREKNGWMGDAAFACESGLFTFDAAESYRRFVRAIADCQRESGQLPGIVPSPGWGYNYGSGPVWDAAFWMIPMQLLRFDGDTGTIAEYFDAMKKHFAYLETLAEEEIIRFGLGDHSAPDTVTPVPEEFVCSCFFAMEADALADFAEMLGKPDDREFFTRRAREIRQAILAVHPRRTEPTALALYAAMKFGPADAMEKLIAYFENNGGKAAFGIVGAKFIPRLLAENGRADLAFRILTQTEYPGFGNWIARGATTLWEYWDGKFSRNHIMFGDILAWCFIFIAGIRILAPGMEKIAIRPVDLPEAGDFHCTLRTPGGELVIEKRGTLFRLHLPQEIDCSTELPPSWRLETF